MRTKAVHRRGRECLDPAYDVVVVGANVAGASMARQLASRGLAVAIIERQAAPEVGSRSCGDGIERFQFEKLGLEVPSGEFILREVEVAYLCSPDRRTRFRGVAAGIAIDRFGLNQHLLSIAVQAGAALLDSTEVVGPAVEEGRVVGVRHRPRGGADLATLRAPLTVDATGWRGVVRRGVPAGWPIAERVPREEMAIAYREERRRREPVEDLLVEATFDFEAAPRGIYWMADRSGTLVNLGVGMQWFPGVPSPRRVIRERVMPIYPGLDRTEVIRSGGGIIPNRRPIDCPVAPGLLAIGDAACQVQPLSGSGIGASMYAAGLASRVVAEALESGSTPDVDDLFAYPRAYHTSYGADQAANQMLRASLQELTNAQLSRLMAADLVSEEDLVAAARSGRLALSFGAKLRATGKLLGEPRLARALARMQRRMAAARNLYSDYPSAPEGLPAWRRRASRVFSP